jgi:DNA polymerase-1
VGPKTAAKWLNQYGSLEAIVAHAEEIKGKVGENLRAHLSELALAKQLVTVKTDVPLHYSIKELKPKTPDQAQLIEWYQVLEFRSLLAEQLKAPSQLSNKACHYQTILTQEDWQIWLARLQQSELFCFDLETNNLDAMQASIVGIAFALEPQEAIYIPLAHDGETAPQQLPKSQILKDLKPLLENAEISKIGQNLKYEYNVLARYGIQLRGAHYDTMLESYILNSAATRHNMDALALKYLGHRTISYEEVAGKGAKQILFNKVAVDKATAYAAEDADITLQLHQHLWPQLEAIKPLKFIFEQVEMPLVAVLSRMERNGVFIDAELLQQQSETIAEQLTQLEEQTYASAGEMFNLASPKQLQVILFERLGLPILKKTPKGQPSTAENVLQELALNYPLPKLILDHRRLSKLKSTYTDALPKVIHPQTGRVHTSYNQAITSTGRLSSTQPNLQNIPIRTEAGRQIRQAFIAPAGYQILAADYSQIELRIMAHLSGDEGLIHAFQNNLDIHRATAADIFAVSLEQVTREQRRKAKAINFGLIYGMSAYGLAQQINVDSQTAQNYMDRYFQRYPGVYDYMEKTRAKVKQRGYVETLYGRRLYLPDIDAKQPQQRRAAERAAINAPMQGTAADIIKLAMIAMDKELQKNQLDAKMVMQVHDELVFEVAQADIAKLTEQVKKRMTENSPLTIPLIVDVGVGNNWDEAH